MNNPILRKILRGTGLTLFFVLALVLFVRLTLPLGQARELVKDRIIQATGATQVEIADLSLLGLIPSGVEVEGLTIALPSAMVKTPERGVDVKGPARTISSESFEFRAGLMALMGGEQAFTFEGALQNGRIDGGVFDRPKAGTAQVVVKSFEGIDIGPEGLFQALTGLELIGTLGGSVDLAIPSAERDGKSALALDQLTGSIALVLSDAFIVQPIFDFAMGGEPVRMAFTKTRLGTLTIRLRAEDAAAAATAPANTGIRARAGNVIQVEALSAEGGDIEVALAPRGTLALAPGQSLKEAAINIHLAVRPNDAWIDMSVPDPGTPGAMTTPNSGVRTLMTMGPLKAHTQDGQFGVAITGTLGQPTVRLERPRTRVGGGASRTPDLNGEEPAAEEDNEEDEEEPAAPRQLRSRSSMRDRASNAGGEAPLVRPAMRGTRAIPAGTLNPPAGVNRVDSGTLRAPGGLHLPAGLTAEDLAPPMPFEEDLGDPAEE